MSKSLYSDSVTSVTLLYEVTHTLQCTIENIENQDGERYKALTELTEV